VKEEGRETVIATLSKGDYFGEMALLSDEPRNATVRARTRTVTAVTGRENFIALLHNVRIAGEDVKKNDAGEIKIVEPGAGGGAPLP
jgi:CRP-like cAMP-binding protein